MNYNSYESINSSGQKINLAYQGGRHLDAISKNKTLNIYEVGVMHFLASKQDFTRNFQQWRFASMQDMAEEIHCSVDSVLKAIKKLVEKGYLEKQRRGSEKERLPNNYKITPKIFEEFMELKLINIEANAAIVDSKEVAATVGEVAATVGEVAATVGEVAATVGEVAAGSGKGLPLGAAGTPSLTPSLTPSFFPSEYTKTEKIKESEKDSKELKRQFSAGRSKPELRVAKEEPRRENKIVAPLTDEQKRILAEAEARMGFKAIPGCGSLSLGTRELRLARRKYQNQTLNSYQRNEYA